MRLEPGDEPGIRAGTRRVRLEPGETELERGGPKFIFRGSQIEAGMVRCWLVVDIAPGVRLTTTSYLRCYPVRATYCDTYYSSYLSYLSMLVKGGRFRVGGKLFVMSTT